MCIRVEWDNPEQTIVHCEFDGLWDWRDFIAAQVYSTTLIQSVSQRVHIIGDVTKCSGMPLNALAMFRGLDGTQPLNTGTVVLVGTSTFAKQLVNMYTRLYPENSHYFAYADSIDEARERLRQQDTEEQTT